MTTEPHPRSCSAFALCLHWNLFKRQGRPGRPVPHHVGDYQSDEEREREPSVGAVTRNDMRCRCRQELNRAACIGPFLHSGQLAYADGERS